MIWSVAAGGTAGGVKGIATETPAQTQTMTLGGETEIYNITPKMAARHREVRSGFSS